MEIRALDVAQHEAAHVVVGASLGLRLHICGIGPWPGGKGYPKDPNAVGFVSFHEKRGDGFAQAIMMAAGVAWDRALRYPAWHSSYDYSECRKIVRGRQSVEACVTSAAAMLAGLTRQHARVTRVLLERDLTADDLNTLCRGEALEF